MRTAKGLRRALVALGLGLVMSSCGSGTAALFGNDSSGSGAPPPIVLELVTQIPAADQFDEDPTEIIRLVFSDLVDFSALRDPLNPVRTRPGDFELYELDRDTGERTLFLSDFGIARKDPPVSSPTFQLFMADPLRLEQDYVFVIKEDVVKPEAGSETLSFPGSEYEFGIDDGVLEVQELVTFLSSARRLFYRHPMSGIAGVGGFSTDAIAALAGIETSSGGGTDGDFVIAVTLLQANGSVLDPTLVFRETDPSGDSITLLGAQSVNASGLTTIAFSGGGKSFCSDSGSPKQHVYASQFARNVFSKVNPLPGWEFINDESSGQSGKLDVGLDDSEGERWLSWPLELAETSTNDTVAAWWAWTEYELGDGQDTAPFDSLDVWAVSRSELLPPPVTAAGDPGRLEIPSGPPQWTAPQRLNVDMFGERLPGFAGAPFLLEDPTLGRVYALWPQTSRRIDLYGKRDLDNNGLIPDPQIYSTVNNQACFPGGPGSIIDAEADGETIDSYYFSYFERSGPGLDAGWSVPQQLMLPGPKRLGRPTSMVLDDEGRCAIFWRSARQSAYPVSPGDTPAAPNTFARSSSIVAATTNLRDENPQLSIPQPLTTSFVWDEVWVPCCDKLSDPIEKMLGAGVPAAALIPGKDANDSRVLVSWFAAASAGPGGIEKTANLMVAEFDLANNVWDETTRTSVTGKIKSEINFVTPFYRILSLGVDSSGNALLSWSLREVESDGSGIKSNIFAARRLVTDPLGTWNEVTGPNETGHSRPFQVNLDGQCVNTSGTELGGFSEPHASNQALFSWTNEDCAAQVNGSTILRRFR